MLPLTETRFRSLPAATSLDSSSSLLLQPTPWGWEHPTQASPPPEVSSPAADSSLASQRLNFCGSVCSPFRFLDPLPPPGMPRAIRRVCVGPSPLVVPQRERERASLTFTASA
jgi:hypothetical protein